jgi:pSer/pThr/pTyr-binding forkhead associated (FHA) protein
LPIPALVFYAQPMMPQLLSRVCRRTLLRTQDNDKLAPIQKERLEKMSYGRLDVFWPDGPAESYSLEKPIIAVGRSSGNDIVLDTTSVSRYHISLTFRDNQMILEDLESVNGTYIDGERIRAHEPRLLRGGEEVMVGDIRVIYHPDEVEIPTRPNRFAEETQKIEVQQPNFKVELQPPTMPVTPGTSVQAVLYLKNLTSETERYYVEVTGVPKAWIRLERAEIELSPDQDTEVGMTFKPLRRSDSAPGDYPVVVRVRPKSAPEQGIEAPMKLKMLSFNGFGVALGTPRIANGANFELHLHNQGSIPLPLVISGRTPGNDLVFEIRPPGLTLGPGERQTLRGRVQTRSSTLVGGGREKPFDVVVQSQDPSHFVTAVPGVLDIQPAFPVWMQGVSLVGVIVMSLAAIVIIGILLIVLTRPAATPDTGQPTTGITVSSIQVKKFTVKPNPILRNVSQSFSLTWDVAGATAVKIRGLEAVTGTSNDQNYPPTYTLSFDHVVPRDGATLTLLATGDGESNTTQPLTLTISNPTCQINNAQMTYGGPGEGYAQQKTLPANTTIEVDGQNPAGTWLHRVPAPDPQSWVPVSALTCPDFALKDLTIISDIPALPTVKPTITAENPTLVISTTLPPTFTIVPSVTEIIVPTLTAFVRATTAAPTLIPTATSTATPTPTDDGSF